MMRTPRGTQWIRTAVVAALAAAVCAGNCVAAQADSALVRRLQKRVSATWQDQQLAVALSRLASAGEFPVWIDRRVDPQQTISLQLVDDSLGSALLQIADKHSLGVTLHAGLVYVGPPQAARELATLSRDARKSLAIVSARNKKKWLRASASQWPRLTEPRALVNSWLLEAKIELQGGELIPHDLWPEQALPPISLIDRMVLLLAGFDLTCRVSPDGNTCTMLPIERPMDLVPATKDLRAFAGSRKKPRAGKSLAQRQFTLRLQNQPLGRVLDQLAKQLELDITWEVTEEQGIQGRLTSCAVEDADLDGLLRAILEPVDLKHRREGKRILIQDRP